MAAPACVVVLYGVVFVWCTCGWCRRCVNADGGGCGRGADDDGVAEVRKRSAGDDCAEGDGLATRSQSTADDAGAGCRSLAAYTHQHAIHL